jgi:hypothetical protein
MAIGRKISLILIISLIIIIIAVLFFYGDRILFGLARFYENRFNSGNAPDRDTFAFIVLGEDEGGQEEVTNIFLVDTDDKDIQAVCIPLEMRVSVPEISQQKIGDLHPFGNGSLIARTLSESLGIPVDHYVMIKTGHTEDILRLAAPVDAWLDSDISIGRNIYKKGALKLDSSSLKAFISMDMQDTAPEKLHANKLFVIKEVLNNIIEKDADLHKIGDGLRVGTDIEDSPLSKNILYKYGKKIYYKRNLILGISGDSYSQAMGEDNEYLDVLNTLITDPGTSFYYTILGGAYGEMDGDIYFLASPGSRTEIADIILNNNYIDLDLENLGDFSESFVSSEQEERTETGSPAAAEEEASGPAEDVKTEVIVLTEEEEALKKILQLGILNSTDDPVFQPILDSIKGLGYAEDNILLEEPGENTIYEDSIIYYKDGMYSFASELGSVLGIKEGYVIESQNEPGFSDIFIIIGIDHTGE